MKDVKVHGKVAAVFIAVIATLLISGFFVYFRSSLAFLELYPPAGKFSGIWFYSDLLGIVFWIISYSMLRNKEQVSDMRTWIAATVIATLISIFLAESSLKWSVLFK